MFEQLKNKTILVTGGAGFIGSNLCDRFIAEGAEVVCLDDLSTGFKRNIEQLMDHERFTFIQGDVRDLETCRAAVQGCTLVSHQAALGSIPRSLKYPEITMSVNVQGFVNVCKASTEAGIKRLVYASSSSVYGDNPELPKVEERIGKALSPYALSKQMVEQYADFTSKISGIQMIGLRYFNVFGPRQSAEGPYAAVIPRFIQACQKGEGLVIYGDGSYSRDFTYVENIVNLNLHALISEMHSMHEVFNGACGDRTTIKELAETILSIFKTEFENNSISELLFKENRPGDIPHSKASIKRSEKVLKYQPQYSLKKDLSQTISELVNSKKVFLDL